jgi:preprotein translocase subunit SecG
LEYGPGNAKLCRVKIRVLNILKKMTKLLLFQFILLILLVCCLDSRDAQTTNMISTNNNSTSSFAICAVTKNEKDIREWVIYHHKLGCSKFYLYDNGEISAANYLKDYVKAGIVEIIAERELAPQLKSYHRCLKDHRRHHAWLGFIDIDEFIVTKDSCSIPSILRRYERYGGLTLNWMMFGSSGHVKKPPGGVLGNYWQCFQYEHIKSIVNTKFTLSHHGNPHSFLYAKNWYSVDTNFVPVKGPHNPFRDSLYEIMHINHYHLKSKEEFDLIKKRGRASTKKGGKKQNDPNYFNFINSLVKKNCSILTMPTHVSHCPIDYFKNRPISLD